MQWEADYKGFLRDKLEEKEETLISMKREPM
jgi:hypothetical protein